MNAEIISLRRFGPYALLCLRAPAIARCAEPGQFVMVRAQGEQAPFWRRPFSICRTAGEACELFIKTKGQGTRLIAEAQVGQKLDVIGPLGRGFSMDGREPRILIGGGYGAAPLLFLAERLKRKRVPMETLLGGRSREDLCLLAAWRRAGAKPECTTEDGTHGERGLVTQLLAARLRAVDGPVRIAACGPHAMLAAVAKLAARHAVPAEVSLEEVMACGLGLCNGCVRPVNGEYRRVCKDGPVFPAAEVDWHA